MVFCFSNFFMNRLLPCAIILLALIIFSVLTPVFAKSPTWLDGNWIGLKYQVNAYKKWEMTLSLSAEKKIFTVYYPELECAGTLELMEMNEKEAIFIEKINGGSCL